MKRNSESALDRLLRAAARVRPDLPAEAPFGFETRVLARWRSGGSPESDTAVLDSLVRRAFFCACAIVLASLALSLRSINEAPPNEMVIVDSAIQLTLMQQ